MSFNKIETIEQREQICCLIVILKVFMLHMENTGLREIEPYFLQATGNYHSITK